MTYVLENTEIINQSLSSELPQAQERGLDVPEDTVPETPALMNIEEISIVLNRIIPR